MISPRYFWKKKKEKRNHLNLKWSLRKSLSRFWNGNCTVWMLIYYSSKKLTMILANLSSLSIRCPSSSRRRLNACLLCIKIIHWHSSGKRCAGTIIGKDLLIFLSDSSFTLETDHKPLLALMKIKHLTPCIQWSKMRMIHFRSFIFLLSAKDHFMEFKSQRQLINSC